mmetsp:Transcript_8119/g.13792  ORF Transcript_8119/g.13792 Transcript_8119/m.13792 type:complete len:361 (-) Transcript_8119:241-1323(-)|eukprot:CAMPEP_0114423282 /NCGR_PEP_ID=MMETSP0103-20121206/6065_1 /TAXON_ID=37642 ORGANISM="Paraphysomonas imperforata, Strain PA2" /NCGR_SAMPLE_ID=MMETSP0103 /ASSEMBLY_ACC=CAM_ASM_000201 /LENGTH=360 /DNA_ID=CAMNT_0001591933 /DNA_START=54 /DNA_END=1136 /DNA_ORIENTATION=+
MQTSWKLALTFLAPTVLSLAAETTTPITDDVSSSLFDEFVKTFNKEYQSHEEKNKRYAIFAANVERITALNENGRHPYAQFSAITRWADMTQEEYSQIHGLTAANYGCQFDDMTNNTVPLLYPTAEPKDSLDYVAEGATVPVKDQGLCASCWAHATTATVEGRLMIDTGSISSLSEQYLLDCDTSRVCKGCCGGLSERSLQWLAGDSGGLRGEGAGISSEEGYPYVSESGTDPTAYKCDNSIPLVAQLTGFGMLPNPTESSMLASITQYGVLSVAMDASILQFYTSGIITDYSSCSDSNNHAVAIVGYGTEGDVNYFKVRNSYSTEFGEEGYFRMSREASEGCGMYNCVVAATGATFVTP